MRLHQLIVKIIQQLETPLFNPFEQDFHYNGHYNHCNVIVHPGYSTLEKNAQDEIKTGGYGQYDQYLENLGKLIMSLESSDELTIFAIEDRIYQGEAQSLEGLSPFNSGLIVVTYNCDGAIKRKIKTQKGKRKQKLQTLYSFLTDNSIDEARFAGEWAWYRGLGCLGVLAKTFYKADFNIKGITGCIYPSVPRSTNEKNKILINLFDDSVGAPSHNMILLS